VHPRVADTFEQLRADRDHWHKIATAKGLVARPARPTVSAEAIAAARAAGYSEARQRIIAEAQLANAEPPAPKRSLAEAVREAASRFDPDEMWSAALERARSGASIR
jgi:hypothetical protein